MDLPPAPKLVVEAVLGWGIIGSSCDSVVLVGFEVGLKCINIVRATAWMGRSSVWRYPSASAVVVSVSLSNASHSLRLEVVKLLLLWLDELEEEGLFLSSTFCFFFGAGSTQARQNVR